MTSAKKKLNKKVPVKAISKPATAKKNSLRIDNRSISIDHFSPNKKKVASQSIPIPSLKAVKNYSKKQAKGSLIASPAKNLKASAKPAARPPARTVKLNLDAVDLPAGSTRPWLRLWTKDPLWVFAAWEIPSSALASFQKDLKQQAKIILRIYDRTAPAPKGEEPPAAFDLDVGHANSWYVHLWKDNVAITSAIGLLTVGGKFIPLADSNLVRTPRAGMSSRQEQIWVEIKESIGTPYLTLKKKAKTSRSFQRRRIYFSDDEIRRFYGEHAPSLKSLFGDRIQDLLKSGQFSTDTKHLNFSELYKTQSGGGSELLLSFDVSGSGHLGASEATSSFSKRYQTGQFFFELNADVRIYGRTETDADVWLGKQKIPLNPDGTFSLHYALPDLTIPLSFKAISSDRQEEREIDTTIQRQSAYRIPLSRESKG